MCRPLNGRDLSHPLLSLCSEPRAFFAFSFHDFSFPPVHQTRAIDAAPRVYLSSLSFQIFFFFSSRDPVFVAVGPPTIDPSTVVLE